MGLWGCRRKVETETVELNVRKNEQQALQRLVYLHPPASDFGVNLQLTETGNVLIPVACKKCGYCGRLPLTLSNAIMRKYRKEYRVCCDLKILDYSVSGEPGNYRCTVTVQITPDA